MYIDSINKNNTDCSLSAFGNLLICSNAISANKTVTFPNGYELDSNLSFKILFTNGHNCIDDSTHMTLSNGSNTYPIVVNKDGTLIPLPIHAMDEGGVTVYKSLQPNTILEMYFDSTYATNTGAFVIIGNPTVLSSETDGYTIYANGKVDGGNVGDVKSTALVNIPSYGWLECNGQSVPRTDYPLLFDFFNTQTQVVGSETKSLLDIYGYVDSDHFNLPDYQEVALVGAGTNLIDKASGALATSDIYTVGQFKDDKIKRHDHFIYRNSVDGDTATLTVATLYSGTGVGFDGAVYSANYSRVRAGPSASMDVVNRGKRKGVKFIIKVL